MDLAIVGVCFDSRQRRILETTIPSWRRYAERYRLPLIVIERDHAAGDFYWNKHLLYRLPELKSYRYLLFLTTMSSLMKQRARCSTNGIRR